MNSKTPPIYRKNAGGREVFSIVGSHVVSVLNKEKRSYLDVQDNAMLAEGIVADYRPCTEEEFNKAYSDALAIVTMKKIP